MNLKTKTRTLVLSCLVAALAGCSNAPGGNNRTANTAAPAPSPAAERPLEGASLDAEIQRLEKLAERNPGEDSVTKPLAAAYVRRGNTLRAAGDLRAALKEYRSAIKYDEDNEEAQKNIADIVPQVEGEKTGEYGEPAPLPITPNVTTDTDDNTGPSPTAQPSPRKNVNR